MHKELDDTGERLIPEGNQKTLTYGEHMARYLSIGSIAKDKKILDIATGTGYGAKLLSSSAKKVFGVDLSKEAIDYAKKHYSASNIEYMVGSAEKIPLQEDSVDIVISFETIEHLRDIKTFLKEVKRVLSPGGVFIVSTPNDEEFMDGNEFHLHEFNRNELKAIFQSTFKNYKIYNQGTYFATALLNEDNFKTDFHAKLNVAKTFRQNSEKAIYYLAIASDVDIENMVISNNVVLADEWSTKEDIRRDNERQDYKNKLEKKVEDFNATIEENRLLRAELKAIKSSHAWRLLSALKSFINVLFKK